MKVYLRFVNAWYSKEFIEVFLHPQDFLQLPAGGQCRPRRQRRHELADPLADGCLLHDRAAAKIHSALSAPDIDAAEERFRTRATGPPLLSLNHERRFAVAPSPRSLRAILLAFASCQTTATTSHQFAEPSGGWQTKSGQLAYTDKSTSLIGEVLVRHRKAGDFELTFTKAGGITLLSLRQDATHR